MRIEEGFQQAPYDVLHPYSDDPVLPGLLRRLLPQNAREEIEADILRCGEHVVKEIRPLSDVVKNPTLVQYDHWGRRVDELHTSEGWRKLEEFGIKEGFVSIAYEKKYGALSRVYSSAKITAATGDCHVVMCPLGMTDGTARIIELSGTEEMKQELLPRLISRDPSFAYMSGQWMTERPGGSDISQSETTAKPTTRIPSDLGPPYLLNGFKWFSSAAEGNIAVALGRTSPISEAPGSRGLSLFVIPLRHGPYSTPLSNGVKMHRLKNKFGTHGLPTAELELENTRGWLIGELGQGVKTVATVLNVTRVLSAIHLLGSLQRSIAIARSYALVRTIDGGKTLLSNTPLHVATLADATLLYRAVTYLAFGTIELLGKSECEAASGEEEMRLRMLTPAVKGYASVRCPTAMEEMMGALGGLGYMEEVGIGRLIRDSLVERIWEGTVNVLALDLVRATKKPRVVESYMMWAQSVISSSTATPRLSPILKTMERLSSLLQGLPHLFFHAARNPLLPRLALNYFASISCGIFLLQHASWAVNTGDQACDVDVEAFQRWMDEGDIHTYAREVEAVLAGDCENRVRLNSLMVYGAKL